MLGVAARNARWHLLRVIGGRIMTGGVAQGGLASQPLPCVLHHHEVQEAT